MEYASRGLRRRGDSDKWQVVLSHKDPLTGETVPSYHTVEAKTQSKAEKARDELILDLERRGATYTSSFGRCSPKPSGGRPPMLRAILKARLRFAKWLARAVLRWM